MTTQFHVWILPGFYDPLWWKPSDDNRGDSICTDEQMLEAINSTLFVDVPVVQPYNITYLVSVSVDVLEILLTLVSTYTYVISNAMGHSQ